MSALLIDDCTLNRDMVRYEKRFEFRLSSLKKSESYWQIYVKPESSDTHVHTERNSDQ